MDLHLEKPEFLWALGSVLILAFALVWLLRWKKSVQRSMGDPELVADLVQSHHPGRFLAKCVLALSALGLIILALSNPQGPGKQTQGLQGQGLDVMLALDLSKSMLAQDVHPSRLEKGKQFLLQLLDDLGQDRVGFIEFAGHAYLQMPLSLDQRAARMYIQEADPQNLPTQGTVISEALRLALSSFPSEEHKYKAIVLVSDGEDHDPDAEKTARQLAQNGIVIYTVGVGTLSGARFLDPNTGQEKKDENGTAIVSQLQEPLLESISAAAQGSYLHLEDVPQAAARVASAIGSMEKRPLKERAPGEEESYFPWLLATALLCLLVSMLLSEKRNPPRVTQPLLALALLLGPGMVRAQSPEAMVARANRFYRENKTAEAMALYQKAMTRPSPVQAAAAYNLGSVLFHQKDYDQALQALEQAKAAAPSPEVLQKAWYNQGVCYQQAHRLQESIDAWKKALLLDPSDRWARENLQKALREQPVPPPPSRPQDKPQKSPPKASNAPPSRLSQQEVEQKLQALEQKEKEVEEKVQQNKIRTPSQPDKDW